MTKAQAWNARISGVILVLGGFGLAVNAAGPRGSDVLVSAGLVLLVFGGYTAWKGFGKTDA